MGVIELSGRFPSSIVDRIRESNDIVETISKYVQLKRVGNRYTGLCPFHAERTPSFSVSKDKQLFYCFGCQASGNVFSFVMKMEGLTFSEAVVKLGLQVGIDPSEHYETESQREQREHRELLIRVNNFAQKFYSKVLLEAKDAQEARDYLVSRGMGAEDIEKFGLGYSPQEWTALLSAANKKRIETSLLLELGLALKSEDNRNLRDRFRNRVMFPIYNIYNNVIGFGGRVMEDINPKYLNSNENSLFSKRYNLYGLNLALQTMRSKGYVVLVEGYFDVISAHKAGVANTVASLGTALTSEQCKLISRYCKKVVVCYDGDSAGIAATLKAIDILNKHKLEVRVARLNAKADPDSFIKENGAKAFENLIETSISDKRFSIELIFSQSQLNSIEERLNVLKELISVLSNIEGQTERIEYIHEVAERLSLDVHSITTEVNSQRRRMMREMYGKNAPEQKANDASPIDLKSNSLKGSLEEAEKNLLKVAVKSEKNLRRIVEEIQGITLSRVEHEIVLRILSQFLEENKTLEVSYLIDRVDEEYRDYVTEVFTSGSLNDKKEIKLEDAVDIWKKVNIMCQLKALDAQIAKAEEEKNLAALKEILKQQQNLRELLGKNTIIY